MSGTRLLSRTEPATERPLLLIAAHGETGGAGNNSRLAEITVKAQGLLPDWELRHGVLNGAPSIEEALQARNTGRVTVWPFFMSRGYYIEQALRQRLESLGVDAEILPELGIATAFVEEVHRMLRERDIGAIGRILMLAHGSTKGPTSRLAAEHFSQALGRHFPDAETSCAFLDEAPFAADSLAMLDNGATVVSLFAGDGLHGQTDFDKLTAAHRHRNLKVIVPTADTDAMVRVLIDTLKNHGRDARSGRLPQPAGRMPVAAASLS